MATSLNSVTFPLEPSAVNKSKKTAGDRYDMCDSTIDFRPHNTKGYHYVWAVQCDALTTANVATLSGAFDAAVLAGVTWAPPEGGSFTVRADPGSWKEVPDVQGGVLRWTVTFTLEEAA